MLLPHDDLPTDIARMIDQLQPEPLHINRDELFFQAGFAAGARGRSSQRFWPALAAALLLISIGLSVAIVRQPSATSAPPTSLAAAQAVPANQAATNIAESSQRAEQDPFFAHQQPRNWQRLASAAPLPPGRLTAMGWEELPPEAVKAESATESTLQNSPANHSTKPDAVPHRPATYLELMRQQREG